MQERRARSTVTTTVVALVVLVLDQGSKWWALQVLDDRDVGLIGGLRLHLVFNRGSAFGLGSRFAPLLAIAAVGIVVVLLRAGRSVQGRPAAVALGLVLGGAVGNLVDRVARRGEGVLGGYVVDFVDLRWWPVFNLADAAIVVGAALLVLTFGRTPVDSRSS